MIIFGGSRSITLAERVCGESGFKLGERVIDLFPDSEIYLRIKSRVSGRKCVLIQSAVDNASLVETFLFLDALRDAGAGEVHAVFPYLAYLRQNKRFKEGEALSAKTVLGIIDRLSDSITILNPHFLDTGSMRAFYGIELRSLDALPLLAGYFRERLGDPVIVAPDKGAVESVGNAAKMVGCEFDYLEKRRIGSDVVEIEPRDVDVEGRDVVILDDMVSTGGTMIEASRSLRSLGAKSINLGCVHGVFSRGTEKLDAVSNMLVYTDSVGGAGSLVSVAGLIAECVGE